MSACPSQDVRAKVFFRILQWLLFFVKCGGLLGFILENVLGITHSFDGIEPMMNKMVRILKKYIPEFDLRVDILHAEDYKCPQSRTRVFLRGIRKNVAAVVPNPLAPFGRRLLKDSGIQLVLRGSFTWTILFMLGSTGPCGIPDRWPNELMGGFQFGVRIPTAGFRRNHAVGIWMPICATPVCASRHSFMDCLFHAGPAWGSCLLRPILL